MVHNPKGSPRNYIATLNIANPFIGDNYKHGIKNLTHHFENPNFPPSSGQDIQV